MKNLKLLALLIAFLLVPALAAGCSGSQPAAEGEGKDKLVFGMVIKEPGAPYIQAFMAGAEEKAKELGVEVIIKDGQADSLKILDIIDNFINQDIDGFIMAGAVDLKAIVPGIKKLNEANIPVMALDTSPEGGKVDMFLSFDLEKSSARAAEVLVQGIKDRNGGQVPQGKVIEITGSLEDMFAQAVSQGFHTVMAQYPQLEIVQGEGKWNNEDAHKKTTDLLTRHGDEVLAIFVHTPDIMGPGVVSAIEAAGLDPKNYGITGICMGPEGRELIKQGKILAIVGQPALSSAQLAVQYLYDMNTGTRIPQIGDTVTKEGELWSPAEVVKNPWADEGAFMILNGPLVPLDVDPDDPRLWENQLSK